MYPNCILKFLLLLLVSGVASTGFASDPTPDVPEQTRRDLFEARDAAWRSFFETDPAAAIEKSIGPGVIAIQQNDDKWDNRTHLITVAKAMQKQNIKLIRVEFPRTEVQLFGDTAILYYSYIFETGIKGKQSYVDAGRGTEVFVRQDGRWIDVGWHLDAGPFQFKDGHWIRQGEPPPPTTGRAKAVSYEATRPV